MTEHQLIEGMQEPEAIRRMFDEIAPTYDSLNHLLSFGMDFAWRKKAIAAMADKRGGRFLDIAAGSGDLSLDALALAPSEIVATDFSRKMLNEFQHKLGLRKDADAVRLLVCDGLNLPFPENSFDATMIAFGIRNFSDRLKGLQEMLRVLKPGGISIVLELSEPASPLVRLGYLLYTRLVLPSIGRIISRHNAAYAYLPQSISKFPAKEEFLQMMTRAGFIRAEAHSLTFGAATIFKGVK